MGWAWAWEWGCPVLPCPGCARALLLAARMADWFPPAGAPESDGALVSASAFIHDVRLVAEMAGAVGQAKTQQAMLSLANETAADFNALWFDGNGSYAGGCRLVAVGWWL